MDEVNTSDTAKVMESVIMRATSLSKAPSVDATAAFVVTVLRRMVVGTKAITKAMGAYVSSAWLPEPTRNR